MALPCLALFEFARGASAARLLLRPSELRLLRPSDPLGSLLGSAAAPRTLEGRWLKLRERCGDSAALEEMIKLEGLAKVAIISFCSPCFTLTVILDTWNIKIKIRYYFLGWSCFAKKKNKIISDLDSEKKLSFRCSINGSWISRNGSRTQNPFIFLFDFYLLDEMNTEVLIPLL